MTTWVGVGWAQRRSVTRKLALTTFARYGDNTAVADGTQVVLTWKPAGAPRSAWKKLVTGRTSRGTVVLRGTLPTTVRGRNVDLRACASAGTCAQSLRVLVR